MSDRDVPFKWVTFLAHLPPGNDPEKCFIKVTWTTVVPSSWWTPILCIHINDTIAVYYMLSTLEWSPYREYLNFLTKELSFNKKHIEEAENFHFFWIYKNNSPQRGSRRVPELLINTFFVILGVEAGQCSYVVLNVDPNLSLNVLINKVLIKRKSVFWELRLGYVLMLFLMLTQISASTFL